ncbi:restriction endonuclease subunit S [Enterococcus faecalis]
MCKLGDLLNEVKRPVKIEDHKEYQLVTVKRRNGGVVSRGNFKGKNILVKNYFVLKKNDYLISKRQVVHGANGIVPENMDGAVVSNEYLVSVGNESIKTDYLTIISQLPQMYKLFFLSSYGIDIEKLVFNVEDWKKRTMLVPNIDEQVKIASFFKIIDDTITLHQRKLDQLKELKKAYLQVMFPVKDERVPKLRFADFEEEWEQCKLGDVADHFEYGLNASAIEYDGENKYLRITDIDDSSRKFIQNKLTSPNINVKEASNYILTVGDILFARTGASVGKTYRYDIKDGKVYFAGFLIRARIKDSFDSEFVYWTTLTDRYNTFIKIMSQRSGQPGINAKEYSSFNILIPSIKEQQKIGAFFKKIDDTITLHQNKINQLKTFKKSYLQNMFI